MSPEHLRAISATALSEPAKVAEPADIYSLAILLWELWQGHRPFDTNESPQSWSEAVAQQLEARDRPLPEVEHYGGASERVLEEVLRRTLQSKPEDRPSSGTELAGRLKLALFPDAAKIFDPDQHSWRGWLMRQSPWIVAGFLILAPNILAGIYGFFYNYYETLQELWQKRRGA